MNLNGCLILRAKELKDFDKQGVIDAAQVYQTRGREEDEANALAIEDHIRELERERDRVLGDTLEAWKAADPKGYEKALASPAPKRRKKAKADPLAAIREFYTPGNIIFVDYWKQHDKVLEFNPGDGPGQWSVKVVQVVKDTDGKWVPKPGEQARWHSTTPGKDKIAEAAAPKKPVTPQVDAPAGSTPLGAAPKKSAISDLGRLFGGDSLPKASASEDFNEFTYLKAQPMFAAAIEEAGIEGGDLKESMRAVVTAIKDEFGLEVVKNMQPYIVRYIRDIRDGKIQNGALPAGWSESSPGGMATNQDPVSGGIVDAEIASGKWFVIPNNDAIQKIEGMASRADALKALEDAINTENSNESEQRGDGDLERDSQDAETANGVGQEGVLAGSGGNGQLGGSGIQGASGQGRPQRSGSLFGPDAPAPGEPGDQSIYTGAGRAGIEAGSTGSDDDLGGGDVGFDGPPIESNGADLFGELAESSVSLEQAKAKQRAADKLEHKPGLENIRATLPVLLDGQQQDVHTAETRFAKEDGYGMLFTNGTGTGKTFTGLGIIKRMAMAGKSNIIITVPSDKIAKDWVKSAKMLNLDISLLENTKDSGRGIVVTTYANFGQNPTLAKRNWDLVVADEAHRLSMNAKGGDTLALDSFQALTMHPDGAMARARMLHGDIYARIAELQALAKSQRMSDDMRNWQAETETQAKLRPLLEDIKAKETAIRAEVAAAQGAGRTRSLFLSATPFAYEKSIEWANGYLFDYSESRGGDGASYNSGNARDQFFMQHFGYRMRYNKLTEPDAKVDRGVMQRQFNTWLKQKGSVAGRMLDVKADYDRRFVLTPSAIGARIDEALEWFEAKRKAGDARPALEELRAKLAEQFTYLERRYLLEAIKAREVIPHIREHLALGRKVVVVHDYKKGGARNPFLMATNPGQSPSAAEFNEVLAEWQAEFKDLIESKVWGAGAAIETIRAAFPNVLLFNGDVPKSQRQSNVEKFQDDASGPQVLLGLSHAMKEGVSLHDTTGKHQRVLINLGQPTAPVDSIQIEGRIYRTGQITDAIIRYLNTGTDWEKWAFATTIAQRASAAENLGMGELARALKDSFIAGFEESDDYRAGMEGEGKGGKERDKAANAALTEYDRARAFYFGTQKKTAKTKAAEGTDYFATPEPVGLKMMELADIRPGESVLEPSAGHGAIARWAPETSERTAIEPSMALRSRLAMVFDGTMLDINFEDLHINNKFDAIVLNPPFGTAGRTAIDHVIKAATHLRDGGRIVALIPRGSADAKFDKWFYEESTRPAKPVAKLDYGMGAEDIYVGDTAKVEMTSGEIITGKVTDFREGKLFVKEDGDNFARGYAPQGLRGVARTGPRTESYKAADGLHLVSEIKLPAVTFERAGTKVSTRIVVIEKSADAPQQTNRDYSDAEDINTLFDRMEHLSIPARAKPLDSIDAGAIKPVKTTTKEAIAQANAAAKAADEQAQAAGAIAASNSDATFELKGDKIVTNAPARQYTTNSGKVLDGVIVPDQTMAKAVDRFTWKIKGENGYFVRLRHIERPAAKLESTAAGYGGPRMIESPENPSYTDVYEPLETRPGTTDKQRDEGRAALDALESAERRILGPASGLRGNQAAVLGSAISRDFREDGGTSFVGKRVTTTGDLAMLGQAVRDPRFETFRVFYTDKSGKILGQGVYSSRLPGAVYLPEGFDAHVAADMASFRASGFWMMHNHPSGRVLPSQSDEYLTADLAAKVPGFQGHVILDHNQYAAIDVTKNGRANPRIVDAPELASKDLRANPEVPHAMLGEKIDNPADLAVAGKKLQVDPSVAVLVGTNANNEINLIVEVADWALNPNAIGSTPVKRMRALAAVRRAVKETGLSRIYAVVPGKLAQYFEVTRLDFLTDVVDIEGKSAAALGHMNTTGALPVTKANKSGLKARASEVGAGKTAFKAVDTESAEFKAWSHNAPIKSEGFKTGEAAVVKGFHGTTKDFAEFDPSLSNSESMTGVPDSSFVFSSSAESASSYAGRYDVQGWDSAENESKWRALWDAGNMKAANAVMMEHYGTRRTTYDSGGNVMPVYLVLQNPMVVDAAGETWKSVPWRNGSVAINGLAEYAKHQGYDGLIVQNVRDQATGTEKSTPANTFFVFSPTQAKSAISNTGAFSPTNPSIVEASRAPYGAATSKAEELWNKQIKAGAPASTPKSRIIGDSGRKYSPEQQSMFRQTGREVDTVTTLGKIRQWSSVNWKQGLFDQFQPVRAISDKGYTLLRLSKGATGAFEAFMHHGKLSLRDGAYDADTTGGVMQEVFFPLGKETTDFLYWIAGNRAERLTLEGKERLFSAQDIAAAKSLAAGTTDFDYVLANGQSTRDRTLIYRDSLTKFNAFNKNVMDMAEQSGLIDKDSRHLWEHEFYVPFYRVVDEKDGGVRGMNIKTGVVQQEAFKKLKGGKEGLNDLLANTLMNWAHLVDASAKNRAAKETLEAAGRLGAAEKAQPGEKNTVWYMDGGKRVEYSVSDPELLVAISSLDYTGLRGGAMDVLSMTKHWLTIGVTASPFFKVRNLIRDSVQAVATSGLSYNVVGNVANGIRLTNRENPEYVSALAGGALIRFGTMLEGNEAARTRQLIKKGAKDEHILDNESKLRAFYDKRLEPGISAYNEIGNRGEEINRMSLYDQLIKQGVDHATASLMARDLMDFSMQGSWTAVRFLAQTVPFFNARLQGMYKLGRAAKSDPSKFGAVLGAVTLFSLALMMAYDDDDDWKKREDWDRDNYWWFKFGGIAYRIPKPFEIGAMATFAERSAELMFNKEMTGKRFREVTWKLLMDQLSMNPVPQLFKPLVDIYANVDSFTKRPIETMGMERLDKERRFNSNTSMPARGLSTATGGALSPVQIDHLVRGYFGWLGAFTVGAGDLAVRLVDDSPSRPSRDYWKFATGGMASELDSAGSRYVTQMYQQSREIETAYGTWRDMQKQAGRMQGATKESATQDAAEYRKDHQSEIRRHSQMESAKRHISGLNERIRRIEHSNMSSREKREAIVSINKLKNQTAKRLVTAHTD